MSGFEIAGIVLGAFPLAIEGWKMCGGLARRWEIWHDTRREYQQCLNRLTYHHTKFELSLQELLLPLVADPPRVKVLIADPKGTEWGDDRLDQALRHRLGGSYDSYFNIVQSLQILMASANKHLGIDSPELQEIMSSGHEHENNFSKKTIAYGKFRIMFSNGEATREQFLTQLHDYNDMLENLLASSDRVRSLEQETRLLHGRTMLLPVDTELCEFWQHAHKVYDAVSTAWSCDCRAQHQTQLMLQHRTSDDREMRMIFRSRPSSQGGFPSGRAVVIHKSTSTETRHEDRADSVLPQSPKPVEQNFKFTRLAAKQWLKTRKRRLSERKPSTADVEMRNIVKVQENVMPLEHSKISNICYELEDGFKADTCFGYLQAEGEHTQKHYVYPIPNGIVKQQFQQPNLEDALREGRVGLTRRQRYMIALKLASSFIQLQSTPWITSAWDKSSIMLTGRIRQGPEDTSEFKEPFLDHNFGQEAAGDFKRHLSKGSFRSLGVTLVELCFGNVIDNHPARIRLPAGIETAELKAVLDADAAEKRVSEVTDEASEDFARAIDWCLSKHATLLETTDWRQEMYQQVVHRLCKVVSSWPL